MWSENWLHKGIPVNLLCMECGGSSSDSSWHKIITFRTTILGEFWWPLNGIFQSKQNPVIQETSGNTLWLTSGIPKGKIPKRKNLPWLTNDLTKMMRKRNRHFKHARSSNKDAVKYRKLRNQVVTKLREAKNDFFHKLKPSSKDFLKSSA